MQTNSTIANQN